MTRLPGHPGLPASAAGTGVTRLITQLRSRNDWGKPAIATELIRMELGDPFIEPGDHPG